VRVGVRVARLSTALLAAGSLIVVFPVRAWADEAPSSSSEVAAAPPPPETPTTAPDTTAPDTTAPDTTEPDSTATTAPGTTSSTTPDTTTNPETGTAEPEPTTTTAPDTTTTTAPSDTTPTTPSTTPAPTTEVHQDTQVKTTGTAGADTGGNTATTDGSGTGTTTPSTGGNASVDSGRSHATGSADTNTITQKVDASAADASAIDVLQVALVINIGIGVADSGANHAAAGSGATGGAASIATGDARANGNRSNTVLLQATILQNGQLVVQRADVNNTGAGLANTGGNAANASGSGATNASIGSGSATAVGNRSDSSIAQLAMLLAVDDGTIRVQQRAVVLNLGVALANSGSNLAGGGISPQTASVIASLVRALGGSVATFDAQDTAGRALVTSGNSVAHGNSSSTAITQRVNARVDGDGIALSSQDALVSNLGVALANSGLNVAGGRAGGANTPALTSATDAIQAFLAALSTPDFVDTGGPELQQALDLGGVMLDVTGDIGVTDLLSSIPDGGAMTGQVHVRQVSGVLTLSIAIARSGQNQAVVAVMPEGRTTASEGEGPDGTAGITTGDARATGNHATVFVCQISGAGLDCPTPPGDPATPADPGGPAPRENFPGIVEGVPAVQPTTAGTFGNVAVKATTARATAPRAASTGDSLPFTGTDPEAAALAGIALVVFGLGMSRIARRHAEEG
jgi:hypothetical protein